MRSPIAIAVVALALGATSLHAQAKAIVAFPDKMTWGPAPTILPAGAKLSVLEGDPTKAGPYTMRLSMPDGYRIPPHFHPGTEHVTVVEGTFLVGMGGKFDAAKLTSLPVGTFAALDRGMQHFAEAKGTTVIQLHGTGPWSLNYVNPADTPKAQAQ